MVLPQYSATRGLLDRDDDFRLSHKLLNSVRMSGIFQIGAKVWLHEYNMGRLVN